MPKPRHASIEIRYGAWTVLLGAKTRPPDRRRGTAPGSDDTRHGPPSRDGAGSGTFGFSSGKAKPPPGACSCPCRSARPDSWNERSRRCRRLTCPLAQLRARRRPPERRRPSGPTRRPLHQVPLGSSGPLRGPAIGDPRAWGGVLKRAAGLAFARNLRRGTSCARRCVCAWPGVRRGGRPCGSGR